jgi:hypothetical protein
MRVTSTALGGGVSARLIDEHLPHDSRHQCEEMRPVGQPWLRIVKELDEGLVHQRRWLQGVVRSLAPHESGRNAPQLAVHERHQLLECLPISLTDAMEQARDLMRCHAHAPILPRAGAPLVIHTPLTSSGSERP